MACVLVLLLRFHGYSSRPRLVYFGLEFLLRVLFRLACTHRERVAGKAFIVFSILVPGGSGQLGSALSDLATAEVQVYTVSSHDLDITDSVNVAASVRIFADRARSLERRPVVINCAAYTDVDGAENDGKRAHEVNAVGAATLAEACSTADTPLIHISTDYVFDGRFYEAYEPDYPRRPQTVYGRTKMAGEDAVIRLWDKSWIVRTAWLYGGPKSFVEIICRQECERDVLRVVNDQTGSPTWANDLAAGLVELARKVTGSAESPRRVLHATNAGSASWYELARAVFDEIGADPERIMPCSTEELARPAGRPAYSVLSNSAWLASGLSPLRPWRDALRDFVAQRNSSVARET